jgi:hypothetical protein
MKKLGAIGLAAVMMLAGCEAEEPAVDTGKLVGVWELVYYANIFVEFNSQQEKENWLLNTNVEKKLDGEKFAFQPLDGMRQVCYIEYTADSVGVVYEGYEVIHTPGDGYFNAIYEYRYSVDSNIINEHAGKWILANELVMGSECPVFNKEIIKLTSSSLVVGTSFSQEYDDVRTGNHIVTIAMQRWWFKRIRAVPQWTPN